MTDKNSNGSLEVNINNIHDSINLKTGFANVKTQLGDKKSIISKFSNLKTDFRDVEIQAELGITMPDKHVSLSDVGTQTEPSIEVSENQLDFAEGFSSLEVDSSKAPVEPL